MHVCICQSASFWFICACFCQWLFSTSLFPFTPSSVSIKLLLWRETRLYMCLEGASFTSTSLFSSMTFSSVVVKLCNSLFLFSAFSCLWSKSSPCFVALSRSVNVWWTLAHSDSSISFAALLSGTSWNVQIGSSKILARPHEVTEDLWVRGLWY